MCVLLITRLLRLVVRWVRKPVNHTSWVALVTPTDRPKSVRNRCLIELFCGVVCVVTCPFDISVGVGAFVIGLGQISSFLSWHIELKVCTWLCYTVLQIKFECCQFASIFVGVMPLLELRILEIHSFPHFSPTCFDILSWNFAYDFVLLYYRSRLCVVNFRQVLCELCPFCNLQYWKYTVFRTFLLHALTFSAEILHMTL